MSFRLLVALLVGAVSLTLSPQVMAKSVVNVTLNNQPSTASLPDNLGMGMPGANMSRATMRIFAVPNSVPAGEVTFTATNRSTDLIHEMILIKVIDATRPLPYVVADNKVNEDAAGHLGEVSELDPGKSGGLTLKLDPGTYMLLCNVPGHYMAGMWTTITVR
jgi:uncharacterized cupredoxin-like copper-binding protein